LLATINAQQFPAKKVRIDRLNIGRARLLLYLHSILERFLPIHKKVPKLARHILRYLKDHPNARDTVEGITVWWVSERAIKEWLPEVRKSLSSLVACGYLKKRKAGDGRIVYRLNRSPAPRKASSRK
jgi:hypothetical protein